MKKHKIPNLSGYYIDKSGNVFAYKKNEDMILMKQCVANGYKMVGLMQGERNSRKERNCRVHVLLAKTFIPNTHGFPFVCHKDGNCQNNAIKNLYWGTAKMNGEDKVKHGTSIKGEKCDFAKLNNEKVKLARLLVRQFGWTQRTVAKFFHISQGTLWSMLSGRSWAHVS